ncbi:MAG: response regulator transcription factor [Acidobacteriota bacterium]
MAKHILVVDDEKDILSMLSYNLEKEGYRVTAVGAGKAALSRARDLPDLILLDVMMPEVDGLEVARRLKLDPLTRSIPVVFLTARGSEIDEVVGLELGAEDYIVKPVSIPKLLARIRAIFRRHETAEPPPHPLRFADVEIDPSSYRITAGGMDVALTKKEFEILAHLAARPGKVVTREALLDALWGDDVHVVDRTVDVHIRKIREKLGRRADWIETVKGVGYRIRA